MGKLEQGQIIWHDFVDSTGLKRAGPHRAVILTPNRDIAAGKPIVVAVISSNLKLADQEDMVELPYLRCQGGHVHTKLTKKSAAICSWLEVVERDDIEPDDFAGRVPGRWLNRILTRVKERDQG